MSSTSSSRPPYPRGVPSKFSPSGAVQPFPGNTIVAHISPATHPALYASLLKLHGALAAYQATLSAADPSLPPLFTLLPPPSWHVTLFEGVCDQVRGGEKGAYWPADLWGKPLDECTAVWEARLRGFELSAPAGEEATGGGGGNSPVGDQSPPYRLRVVGWEGLGVGIGVRLAPQSDGERARIWALRDRLSALLGVRHPHHDRYGLHLSIAYFVRWMSEDERKGLGEVLDAHFAEEGDDAIPRELELGSPEWCVFDDMFEFKRRFYLGEGGGESGDSQAIGE